MLNKIIDNWQVPDNLAVRTAKSMMREFSLKRHEKEFEKLETKEKEWPEKLQCTKCRNRRITKYYFSKTMKHVPRKSKKNGEEVICYHHYCPKCQKTYKTRERRKK